MLSTFSKRWLTVLLATALLLSGYAPALSSLEPWNFEFGAAEASISNGPAKPWILGPVTYTGNENQQIGLTGIKVGDPDSTNLTVNITSTRGSLSLGASTGLSVTGAGTSSLQFSGSVENLNAAIATLRFQSGLEQFGTETISLTVTDGRTSPVQYKRTDTQYAYNPATGKTYELVQSARKAYDVIFNWGSMQRTYAGVVGYPANISGGEENTFLANSFADTALFGATQMLKNGGPLQDGYELGTWYVHHGPENNGTNNSYQGYIRWGPGQPDNSTQWIDLHLRYESCVTFGSGGFWNDVQCHNSYKYLVEYETQTAPLDTNITLTVNQANDEPLLTLSSTSVEQFAPSGTTVGTFTASDIESGSNVTYSFTSGTGSTDNSKFSIVGNELRTNFAASGYVANNYQIRLRAVASDGGSKDYTYVIKVLTNPFITGPVTSLTVNEDTNLSLTGISVQDLESDIVTATVTATNGTLNVTTTTGVTVGGADTSTLTLTGSPANVSTAIGTLVFRGNEHYFGVASVSLSVEDERGEVSRATYKRNDSAIKYSPATNHYYEAVSTTLNWSAARTDAKVRSVSGLSGYLANITSAEEQSFIQSILPSNWEVWFGLNDITTENTFSWADGPEAGQTVSYSNWNPGEPNNSNNNEDCIHTSNQSDKKWNDNNCASGYFYLVEYGTTNSLPTETIAITVNSVNDNPTFTLSDTSVDHLAGSGATVATLSGSDVESGSNVTFSLVAGTGSSDNSKFSIVGNELRTASNLNGYEGNNYSIRVRGTDPNGGTVENVYTIKVASNPVVMGAVTFSGTEDTNLSLSGVTVQDPDSSTVTATVTATNGTLNVTNSSGVSIGGANTATLTLTGTPANVSTSIGTLVFSGTQNYFGAASVSLSVEDERGVASRTTYKRNDSNIKYTPITNHYYEIISGGTWTQARSTALARSVSGVNGYLANITSVAEQQFVGGLTPSNWVFWIGYNDITTEGQWRWADGPEADTAGSYTNWTSGEPNNVNNEDCAAMRDDALKTWNDAGCSSTVSAAVEYGTTGNLPTETIAITLSSVNDLPTAAQLNPSSLATNSGANAVVGSLSSTDVETASSSLSYSLVSGTGSTDNALFTIDGTTLRSINNLDGSVSSYSIRVRVTDGNGGTTETPLTVSMMYWPYILGPDTSTVNEDGNVTLSGITVQDQDSTSLTVNVGASNGTLKVTVSTGLAVTGANTGSLQLVGSVANLNSSLATLVYTPNANFNGSDSLSLTVHDGRTPQSYRINKTGFFFYPANGHYYQYVSAQDISWSDARAAALGKSLYGLNGYLANISSAAENAFITSNIGVLSGWQGLTDQVTENTWRYIDGPEGGQTATYSNWNSGEPNNSNNEDYVQFVANGSGKWNDLPNSPTAGTIAGYIVEYGGIGYGGDTPTAANLIVTINAQEDTPSNISLSGNTIAENAGADVSVGTLSATDADAGDTASFTLVSGAGSTDNGSFSISGTSLRANASFDFEAKSSYSIRIRVTDSTNRTFEKVLTISVTNVNEALTGFSLTSSTIAENAGSNAMVGSLSATDTDTGDTATFTLVGGDGDADNGSFNIGGTSLRANASFDFETKSSYSVRIRATDGGGLTYEQSFVITVTNANDAPSDITLSASSIAENADVNAVVGTLNRTDVDPSDTATYTLVSGDGDADNGAFNISGTNLRANVSFDFETKSSYSVRVRVTDGGGLTFEQSIAITVTDGDDSAPTAPADLTFSNVTGTGVTLTWTPSTDNVGVSGYEVYSGSTLIASATESPYNVTGIASGVSHTLTIVAIDAAGNRSANSNSVTFTTPDVVAPSIPVNITAIESTPTSLRIQWDASTDNVGVTGYNVYRNRDFVGTIKGNRLTITGLKQNTPYSITVMAFDASKNRSAQSVPVILRTADSQAPVVPGAISTSLITKDSAFFSWVASTDNVGVTGYNVYVDGVLIKTVSANRTELTGLTPLTSYSVRLQAIDAAKNRSTLSAPFTITTMEGVAPTVPTNLTASAITRTGFTVSWTASTDNVGVTGYQVLRNGVQVATVRNGLTSFAFAGLALNETHQIAVRAIDAASNLSTLTDAISVSTTPVLDAVAPTAPVNVTSSNLTRTSVRISWTASTDNVAVTAYNIYHNGVYFGTASALSTFFNARNLTANTEHTFTVRAVDAERNLSAASNAVTVTTLP